MSEVFSNVKMLKLFGWEHIFAKKSSDIYKEKQKMKEDALIKKFYSDKSSDQNTEVETIEKNEEENKNI